MAELQQKFETAVPSIKEKLSVEAKLRRAQREDNDLLRSKLAEFADQTQQRRDIWKGWGDGGGAGAGGVDILSLGAIGNRVMERSEFLEGGNSDRSRDGPLRVLMSGRLVWAPT